MLTKTTYIVDMFGYIAADVATRYGAAVNYQYGHLIEIIQTLRDMTLNPTQSELKFPLIILLQDFEEKKGVNAGTFADVSLTLIIAMMTDPGYKASQRYTLNFKPILYPIYGHLMDSICASGYFSTTDPKLLPHTKIDRLYWGKNGLSGNTANTFDDYIDAIEIKNLSLKLKYVTNCLPLNTLLS